MLLQDKVVFLVEDDPVNLAVIRTLLQKEGAQVPFDPVGARTIPQLLEMLTRSNSRVDLVLLDLKLLHGISGYEVLKAIRGQPSLSQLRVVAFTGADPEEEIPKAQAAGFDGYIAKPIARHRFIQDLGLILDGEPVWRSTRK